MQFPSALTEIRWLNRSIRAYTNPRTLVDLAADKNIERIDLPRRLSAEIAVSGKTIGAVPTLDKVSPDTLKRGDSDKEITLTGKNFSKGLFRVTGCDGIKVKESTWQSETEIKIKIDVLADAERGPCQLRVKNGDNFVSGPQTLTIQKAKPEENGQEN